MIHINKKILLTLSALVFGVTLVGVGSVSAQSPSTVQSPMQTLVAKLAQRFNLSESDVQKVFDEHHGEMKATMQVKFEERLSNLVTESKLTEAQKQAVITKMNEFMSEHETLKDMTPDEKRAHMETKKAELEAWATENHISLDLLPRFKIGMKGGGTGRVFRHKM